MGASTTCRLAHFSFLVVNEASEDLSDVGDMLLERCGVDEDIDDVNYNVVLQHDLEHIVNKGLNHGRGVTDSKGHYQIFVIACSGLKCSFVTLTDADHFICTMHVQLGEIMHLLQLFQS